MLRLLWDTGIRVSELCGIQWRDIDTHEQELYIRNKKNKDNRWIFWSGTTHLILLDFLIQRKAYNGDSLFVTYEGAMHPKAVQRFLADLGKTLKLPYPLSPHCLRQGFAHERFRQGADIKLIKEAMGHKSLVSTERYLVLEKHEMKGRLTGYLT
jgi:site-specific recombinase XerD